MSNRPAPITRTDEILLHLVDRVDALSDALAGRVGAPAPKADAPADPAAKKAAATGSAKGKTRTNVTGQ